ncbi:TetR/AcrR family transcriptional regulator [Pseudonocardia sp. MCCB 268]|nr:TetR/AcrR family transcriptional regulator [Pseudonocardia cytotoxica]
MVDQDSSTTGRLLQAAADLIAASPGRRCRCAPSATRPASGFTERCTTSSGARKGDWSRPSSAYLRPGTWPRGGPRGAAATRSDIRAGWDAHVAFGLAHPGFYALMYGQGHPGRRPRRRTGPAEILLGLTREAGRRSRRRHPERAARVPQLTNIGVTLRQIIVAEPGPGLSAGGCGRRP